MPNSTRSSWVALISGCLLLLGAHGASANATHCETIAAARAGALGSTVTIVGTVTVPSGAFDTGFALQDGRAEPLRKSTGAVGEATEGTLLQLKGRMVGALVDDSPYGFKLNLDDGSGPTKCSCIRASVSRPTVWSTASSSP